MKLERTMQCSFEDLCDLMCGSVEEDAEDGEEYPEEHMQIDRLNKAESAD